MPTHDLDFMRNEEAVCPHCRYEHPDSWEFEDGETNCHSCGKPFVVEVVTDITYTTSMPKEVTRAR